MPPAMAAAQSFAAALNSAPVRNHLNIYCATQSPPLLHFQSPKQSPSPVSLPSSSSPDDRSDVSVPSWARDSLKRAAAAALDAVEDALASQEKSQPLPKTVDPRVQIAGNFAPVSEMPLQHPLPVHGRIPASVKGVYVRNGANPQFQPRAGHHFFDGDGMIHAVRFHGDGTVGYCCRFTQTQRLVQEKQLGRPVFPKAIGELHGHSGIARLLLFYARGLLGLLDHRRGTGLANAGLAFFNRRLLAMSEDDLPYHVDVSPSGDLRTAGRFDFDGQLSTAMIAHPKIDPVSGELFSLGYDVLRKPHLRYFRFSPDGVKSPDVEIPLAEPTMVHDFAITENFVVIPDQQVVFRLQEMIRGGSPVVYDGKKASRFGILNRKATDGGGIRWIEVPDCFCFHFWNAWEEAGSDEVVVIGSCMTPADSIFNDHEESLRSVLSEIRLNLRTGESRRRPVVRDESGEVNLEVGMVNRNLQGRKTRLAFLAIAEPWPKVSGFAKVDLETGEVRKYWYGEDRYGGEPFFLPGGGGGGGSGREDEGHILSLVHDEREGKSELQVVDAADLRLEASVMLPSRVPYGFHGTFIRSEDIEG